MKNKELELLFRKNYSGMKNIDFLIQKIKDAGASQMECVKILAVELKIDISTADEIVLNSKAWAANKEGIEKFRDEIIDNAKKMFVFL